MEETIDILADEQRIFEDAKAVIQAVKSGEKFKFKEYTNLVEQYGKLLDEHRLTTIISDNTTVELYESNVILADKVYIDPLTGIYNRRYLDDNLKRVTNALTRSGGNLSVMMLDIDYFKKYNDTYGHSEGDTCLREVAQAISKTLFRPDDFVVRYGGEEFCVILPFTDDGGARYMADNILNSVRGLNITHEQNEAASHVTISIGLTTVSGEHPMDGEDFIKRADQALYLSKQNGRNRYTYMKYIDKKRRKL